MFDLFKKKPRETINVAAGYTSAPLPNRIAVPFARGLPILDSKEHAQIYHALEAYDNPQITSQEMLPEEIRKTTGL